jgi:hypothetical protein
MPYKIKKVKGGYKAAHGNKTMSRKPISKKKAIAQIKAINKSEGKW